METPKKEDLSVAGPGSPISLKKVLKKIKPVEFTLLLDQTGTGFAYDEPSLVYITVEERRKQAVWFVNEIFKKHIAAEMDIPAYLYRYLRYLFIVDQNTSYKKTMPYETDADFRKAMRDKTVDKKDYDMLYNMILYAEENPEMAQAIGLIQLVAGTLKRVVHSRSGIRIFIENPETHMHPKRERLIMSMLQMLKKEYGPPPEEKTANL